MNEAIITVEHVTKQFGKETVLKDVSVTFEQGQIHGLVGHNGSGKTMLMRCICGFVPVTEGTIRVRGKQIGKESDVARNIGLILETPGFLPNYSGYKNLMFLAQIGGKIGKAQVKEAIEKVGLDPNSRKWVSKYSLGMRQRLAIAQAMMEDPDILMLDEPINGLDSEAMEVIRKLLEDLRAAGKTIILASHSVEDIDRLCDHVYRMEKGVMRQER